MPVSLSTSRNAAAYCGYVSEAVPWFLTPHHFCVVVSQAALTCGFTDQVIYQAGNARRPAVAAFQANGGNNDAGALAFVAAQARRSRRSARLLVMISDGLPTECSVAALRSLVARLGRERIACAQVAVRPLEEVCFPHFVEISGGDLDGAVRRFGRTVERLVRATVGGE